MKTVAYVARNKAISLQKTRLPFKDLVISEMIRINSADANATNHSLHTITIHNVEITAQRIEKKLNETYAVLNLFPNLELNIHKLDKVVQRTQETEDNYHPQFPA